LNEHFLALKNKFNNEQKELKARVQNSKDDIERDEASNENKRHRIEVMQNDFRKIQNRFEETKERALNENYNLESTMYTQNHTRTVLVSEKKIASDKYNNLQTENQASDRNIRQGKLAATKKAKAVADLKETRDRLH